MIKFRQKKGFTLVETMIALALLGMLLAGLSGMLAYVSSAFTKVDDYTLNSASSAYVLDLIQKDMYSASSVGGSETEITLVLNNHDTIHYEISNSHLLRDSKTLAKVVKGKFSTDDNKLFVYLVFNDHTAIETTLYPKGVVS